MLQVFHGIALQSSQASVTTTATAASEVDNLSAIPSHEVVESSATTATAVDQSGAGGADDTPSSATAINNNNEMMLPVSGGGSGGGGSDPSVNIPPIPTHDSSRNRV